MPSSARRATVIPVGSGRRAALGDECGQTMSEYALILGGIAITCMLVLLALGGGIAHVFDKSRDPVQRSGSGSFTPPSTLTWPTSLAECADPGWQNYPQFTSEADCDTYVNSLP